MKRLKRHPLTITRRSGLGTILAVLSALLIASALPLWAGKGNGGGGGDDGGGDSGVTLMPAPVEYRVTWVQGASFDDVNAAGLALDGDSNPRLVDAEGNEWDVAALFADAMTDYPGWRLDSAFDINHAGQVSILLVPDEPWSPDPPVIMAIGDLYAQPVPTLTMVEEFPRGVIINYSDVMDMNENGDLLLNLRWAGEEPGSYWVYPYPGTGAPYEVAAPTGFASLSGGNLNGAGQVGFSALYEEQIRKNRIALTRFGHIGERDGSLTNLGQIPVNRINWGRQHVWLNESGTAYAAAPDGVPSIQAPGGEWEPIVPFLAIVEVVSKADSGEEAVVRPHSKGDPLVVYARGYGAFPIEVTSGLNGAADVDKWNRQTRDDGGPIIRGISRPATETGSGYIVGTALILDGNGDRYWTTKGFILTPVMTTP